MPEAKKYEERDFLPRAVTAFAASLLALTIIALLAMGWLMRFFTPPGAKPQPIAAEPRQLRPGPRLQVAPAEDLKEMREAEERQLQSYRWVDAEAGIVAIPIERAMDLIAERGLAVHGSARKRK